METKKLLIGRASERLRNIIIGLLSLCLFFGGTAVGVQWAFGAFNSEYEVSGLFSAAGQGLLPGADVKVRGVNVGEVQGVKLEDLQARVTLAIDTGQLIPKDAKATIRPKTLFGEKFIDIEPGKHEGDGPYLQEGDVIEETLGGFELERVLADLYPILKAVDPAELTTILGGLADAGDGLGPQINRSIVNFQKISEVNAAHAGDTRQFLTDFARVADELQLRADDLVTGAEALNVALPELNAHGDDLATVLDQAARLSRDLADVLDANHGFMRKSVTEGGKTLQLLYDEREKIKPLVIGLRQYAQLLAEAVRIPLGDGTYLAAVKGIVGGGDPCGQGLGESCFFPPGAPQPPPPPAGAGGPAPPTVPGVELPALPVDLPPLAVPSEGAQAVEDLLGGLLGMIRIILKFLAFTLVCLGFTGWLAITIGNIRLFEDTYTLSATFDDVTGLLPNDNVKIAGVVVGKVTGVSVEKGRAKVIFKVRDEIRIPDDSAAGIRWRNLLGQRYVYLYPGESSTTFTDGDHIKETQSVVDLGELFNRLGPIVAAIDPKQVNQFLDAIVEGLDGNQQSVQQVLGDLAILMQGLATRDEAIGDLIEDLDTVAGTLTRRDEQIRTVLDNLTELATTFSANTDIVDTAVTDLGEVSQHLGTLLSSRRVQLDGTLGSLLSVLNTVEGKLDVLDHAIGALDEASAKIFAAGRFGEFLNQVILCAGTTPYDGHSVPPCPGAASGLEGLTGPQAAGAEGQGSPTTTTAPVPTTGVDAVEDLVGSLLGGGPR